MKILRIALAHIAVLFASLALFAQDQTPVQPATNDKPSPAATEQGSTRERGDRGQRRAFGLSVTGEITEIKSDSVVIKTFEGKTATVKLTADTKFIKNRQPATLKDFTIGDHVGVVGTTAGENTWTAKILVTTDQNAMAAQFQAGMGKEFIAGEVKSIDEAKLTILRVDGQTQVIEADENTSFRKQGESITLADIKPGDKIMGRGELKNGVFIPKNLRIGDFPQMQMMQSGPAAKR